MPKRGLLNKLPYTCNGYYLVNDHNDVRVVKQFLGVPNLRRNSPFLYLYSFLTWQKSLNFESFCCWGEVFVPREPPKKERIRKTAKYWTMAMRVEREHSVFWYQCYALIQFIANILSKTSFPVYCFFVFACLFFLLWQFFASSYSLFISPLQSTETGSKDEHSKNKWQNINCYKSNKALCILSRLYVSNGTRCLSSLVRQK